MLHADVVFKMISWLIIFYNVECLIVCTINYFYFFSCHYADCPKVLTLYGMSNLVSENEHSLDLMDPYQRDAKTIGKLYAAIECH